MKNNRVIIVDALRGFALIGIVLIHCIEHFDFFYPPEVNFFFSIEMDQKIMELAFLLISGKAYSIFALMFGFSFFIQMERQKVLGNDFRWRFLWRLTILLFFGFIHSLFYEGDILHIYALLGFPMLIFDRFSNKSLIVIAVLLALQIPMMYNLFNAFVDPNFTYTESFGSGLWDEGAKTYASGTLLDVIKFNIWKGRSAVWGWTFYNGRYIQLITLFIIGLIAGRKKIFESLEANKKLIINFLIAGVLSAFLIHIIFSNLSNISLNETQLNLSNKILNSYSHLAYTTIYVSTFIIFYLYSKSRKVFDIIAAYGRMSLSNYIFQSFIGVFLFYNFGLGLYRYLGSTWSLIYGICFLIVQISVSNYWIKHYYYGPLEWLWRAITFFNFDIKFKR